MKNSAKLRWILLIVALMLALPLAGLSSPQSVRAAPPVPLPTVTGPIPVTATSRPFEDRLGPPLVALEKAGYVDQEFFVSGIANVYDWDAGGNLIVRTPDAPYTTRIIVRRPADLKKFSGTVWVEPFNPTLAIDLDRMWQFHYE
jgi:Alpha/beta hydrolase domain